MNITKTKNGDSLTISPDGILDTANAAAFEAEIESIESDVKNLTIDFAKVEYISSSGLRVLLKAQKKLSEKGSMKVCNVNESVKEVFSLTGFTDILTIE